MAHDREPDTTATFRLIQRADDAAIESIVRAALESFACSGPGYPSVDAEISSMSTAYASDRDRYFVVEVDGVVRGGGGFGRLPGTTVDNDTCELRKMYLEPDLRGRGVGREFLAFLLDEMRDAGYAQAYLETTTQMEAARHLYRSFNFVEIDARMGNTGHNMCDRLLLKQL